MLRVFLTHTPRMRRQYYGEKALTALRALAVVELHEGEAALEPAELVGKAAEADVIIADRLTAAPSEIFAGLPKLQAFLRCAVDIRNIDVAAASTAGVLVTRANPGFVASVCELALGFLIDLSRGISRASAAYWQLQAPDIRMGQQLAGSTLGIIGYGSIGRALASLGAALSIEVVIADPFAAVEDPRFEQTSFEALLARADYVV